MRRNTLLHTPTTGDAHETWEKRAPRGGVRKHPIPNLAAEIAMGKSYQEMVEERNLRTSPSLPESAASTSPRSGRDSAQSPCARSTRSARKSSRPDSTPLLPTPQASDWVEGARTHPDSNQACLGRTFRQMAQRPDSGLLPTPTQQDSRIGTQNIGGAKHRAERGSVALADVVHGQMLPTPQKSDFKGSGPKGSKSQKHMLARDYLCAVVADQSSSPTSATSTGRDSGAQLSSQAASPASLFPMLASDEARLTTAISGRKCSESYKKQGPLGSVVRMLLESEVWNSDKVMLTWKAVPMMKRVEMTNTQLSLTGSAETSRESVMKFSRLLFQLAPSTLPTDGTGCGYAPTILKTPSTVETEGGVMEIRPGCDGHYKLRDQIAMLTTPNVNDSRDVPAGLRPSRIATGRTTDYLSRQIAMLPTPRVCTAMGATITSESAHAENRFPNLETVLGREILPPAGTSPGLTLRLQPAMVEWMMGYPLGFTAVESPDSKPSATPSSRKSHTKSSRKSRKLKGK
jgi:hypothetical protein